MTSPEDGALIGLSTLGPDEFFKLPDLIVAVGKPSEKAARSFDKEVLDRLVGWGMARYDQAMGGYALTQAGGKRVMEVMLVESPMAPIDAAAAMVKFGGAVGIQKADGDRYMVNVIMGGVSYVATDRDLGTAILAAKQQVDRALIGS